MPSRVTIQDIADALGISRNTVSKAINNTGILADATRERVLKKAVEMGYKQFSYVNFQDTGGQSPSASLGVSLPAIPAAKAPGVIALLTTQSLGNSHFASTMLDRVQRELSQAGYSFTMHRIRQEDLLSCSLPASFFPDSVSGILCIEVFDQKYSEFLCSLDIPILFVDCSTELLSRKLAADVLLMNNETEIIAFIQEMKRRGKTKIGFVGEMLHCRSFYERYLAFREALWLLDLPYTEGFCFIEGVSENVIPKDSDFDRYKEYLEKCIEKCPELPDVFICTNDFIAMDLIQAMKKQNIRVPEDVWICGFDDSPESRVITPALTTVHIHSQIMGHSAADLLLSRILEPSLNFRTVHTETTLIYRESTRG